MSTNDLNMSTVDRAISVIACGSSIIPRILTSSSQSIEPLQKTVVFKKMQKTLPARAASQHAPAWACLTTISVCPPIPSHLSTPKSFLLHLRHPQLIYIFSLLYSLFVNEVSERWQNYIPRGWNAQFAQRTGSNNTSSALICARLSLGHRAEITNYRAGESHSKWLQPSILFYRGYWTPVAFIFDCYQPGQSRSVYPNANLPSHPGLFFCEGNKWYLPAADVASRSLLLKSTTACSNVTLVKELKQNLAWCDDG